MKANTRSRTELKSYFIQNAIPTESNFAELIDGMLNKQDDGLIKIGGQPLKIEAGEDTKSSQPAIHFYNHEAEIPDWILNLNPRTNPRDPASAKPGFNVSDGNDNSRLFIDRKNGNVGMGTTSPNEKLHVDGRITSGKLTIGPWLYAADFAFIGTHILDQKEPGNYALLQRTAGNNTGRTFLNSPVDIRFRINNVDHMILSKDGRIGIGTISPHEKLHIVGGTDVKLNGGGYLVLGPTTQQNVALDNNEIMARNNGQKSPLHLQADGGGLIVQGGQAEKQFVVKDDGNVGIGNPLPEEKLHVNGRIRSGRLTIGPWLHAADFAFFGTHILDQKEPENYALLQGTSGKNIGRTFLNSPLDIRFRINNVDRMILSNAGNVGIGTTKPNHKLHIIAGGGFGKEDDDGKPIGPDNVPIVAQANSTAIGIINGSGRQVFALNINSNNGTKTERGMPVFYDKYDGSWRSSIHLKLGKVGIGTNAPEGKLHISGGKDAELSSGGFLILGAITGNNIALDPNEIMARNNGQKAPLHLQHKGGDLIVQGAQNKKQFVVKDDGNVGIGTAAPAHKLHIFDGGIFIDDNDSNGTGIQLEAANRPMITRNWNKFTSGIYEGIGQWGMFMEHNTLTLGIPNIASKALRVKAFKDDSTANTILTVNSVGLALHQGIAAKPGGGSWAGFSDKRLKKDVHPLENALQNLMRLKGITYKWKNPEKQGGLTDVQMGLIAQDVSKVFPEWVIENEDGFLMLSIRGFEALVIEAMREIVQRITDLESKSKATTPSLMGKTVSL